MTLDVSDAVDDLRQLIAKADALAYATEDLFDHIIWVEEDEDDDTGRRRVERLAHLIGATASAVQAALDAGNKLAGAIAGHRAEA